MAVGKITILTPIKWGVMWGIRHPFHIIAGGYLLKWKWSRGLMIDHLVLLGRGAIAGTRGSWASIMSRLVVPAYAASRPVVIRVATRIGVGAAIAAPVVGITAGVLATAGVIAAVHTAGLQKGGIVGPKAIKVKSPILSLRNVEFNPYFMGFGTVV